MKLKRIMMLLCFVATAVVLRSEAYAEATNVQSYLIPTDRPEKVGSKHLIEGHATIQATTFAMADGKTYKETSETGSVDLIGTLTVVAVASNGSPSAVDILVEKCAMITNGTPSAVVKRGDRLAMEKQVAVSNGTVRLNGVELDPKTAFLITSFLPLSESNRTEHVGPFYGLDVRRKVGERWNLNSATFAKYMKTYNPGAKEGDYSGTAEFTGITLTNGEERANVRLDMTSIAPPPYQGPWKLTGFRAKTVMSIAIPLGNKPIAYSGEIDRTQKMWMENDYARRGVLQHLIYNSTSKYKATYTIALLDSDKASSGD